MSHIERHEMAGTSAAEELDDEHGDRNELYEHRYEIRIEGHLDDRWAARFEGLALTRKSNGETLLAGPVADQAALHGFLRVVRDLGLPLVSVTRTCPEIAPGESGNTRPG